LRFAPSNSSSRSYIRRWSFMIPPATVWHGRTAEAAAARWTGQAAVAARDAWRLVGVCATVVGFIAQPELSESGSRWPRLGTGLTCQHHSQPPHVSRLVGENDNPGLRLGVDGYVVRVAADQSVVPHHRLVAEQSIGERLLTEAIWKTIDASGTMVLSMLTVPQASSCDGEPFNVWYERPTEVGPLDGRVRLPSCQRARQCAQTPCFRWWWVLRQKWAR